MSVLHDDGTPLASNLLSVEHFECADRACTVTPVHLLDGGVDHVRFCILLCCACLLLECGCQRQSDPAWEFSQDVKELSEELQSGVDGQLRQYAGTYAEPKLLIDHSLDTQQLKKGQAVYQEKCVQCHGISGDGNGPVAKSMYPRPRDYRKGIFKFTSTLYGAKPMRDDLVRTVRRGIRGTSMPSFKLLPEDEVQAVVDYVLVLSLRGELEEQLVYAADIDGEIDPELVELDAVPLVLERWEEAPELQIRPYTPEPQLTAEHVEAGRKAFLSKGCSKCHGEDGRGMTADNLNAALKDVWKQPTRAADLTSGMLHGGQLPIDVYRRIYAGINGTPMPGFASAFEEEPETIWNLVAYVLHVSNRRRDGFSPPPGPMAPYIPPATADVGGDG